jgi:hypothetical protein
MGTPKISRRATLERLGAAAAGIAVWPYISASAAAAFAGIRADDRPTLVFLTAVQYETIDSLAEAIIPADDHSPGARAARVADYIDLLLSESDPDMQATWTAGLALLDDRSRQNFGTPYARLAASQANELLADIGRHELDPQTPLERFFKMTKDATIRGYYTSEIGIHQELEYKGNKVQREFVGCTHPEHGYTPPTITAERGAS